MAGRCTICDRLCPRAQNNGRPFTTCCKECATGKGARHSEACDRRQLMDQNTAQVGSYTFQGTEVKKAGPLELLLPGRASVSTLVLVTLVGLSDVLCCLPHPVREPPLGAPRPPNATEPGLRMVGLNSARVRENYHKRLEAWGRRAEVYRSNFTLIDQELLAEEERNATKGKTHFQQANGASMPGATVNSIAPNEASQLGVPADALQQEDGKCTNSEEGKCSEKSAAGAPTAGDGAGAGAADSGGKLCKLAEASVREREAARIEARLQGSSVLHLGLIFRDLFVYRSSNPFTLKAMMIKKRRALQKKNKGVAPTDEEVCRELVESSVRSNEAVDRYAKELGLREVTYTEETVSYYLPIAGALGAVAYALEVVCRCRARRTE